MPASHLSSFRVLKLVLGTGERLPCLVNASTWILARVATRWAVRYRRFRVQSSTITDNLRIVGYIYSWAQAVAHIDLDDFLTSGEIPGPRQVESLAAYLWSGSAVGTGGREDDIDPVAPVDIVSGAFDHRLAIVEDFLKWSLDAANRGGQCTLTLERPRLELLFKSLRVGAKPSERIQPIEHGDIEVVRNAIGTACNMDGSWLFPEGVFAEHTRLRNWLMFEVALDLGIRRGELLKLRLDSLPRGNKSMILVV